MVERLIYISIISILTAILIISIFIIINYRNKLKFYIDKKEAIENQYFMQLKHYDTYTNNYNKYRKFKHDIKNNLIILDILMNKNEYEKARNYLKKIEEEFESINIVNYTNNIMLDSILYNINEICKMKSIDFKVKVSIDTNKNNKIQDFIEFLTYSLYKFIEIVEKEEYKKEIICEIKGNEKNLLLYLNTISINNYNKFFVDDIVYKLKEKAKYLNLTIEFKRNNNFAIRCLL